jgi:serine/threonine-protein kinase
MTDRFQFDAKPHGAGGFGTVIKGRDTILERDIAVKVLNRLATEFTDAEQERFRREARILAALSHPSVPAIYDVSFAKNEFLIICEFIEGLTLRQIIEQEGPCSLTDVKVWFTQIAAALEHAHQRGVIHRDVKPGNIIIRPDRQSPCLVDFGIALSTNDAKRITGSGYVVGTPGYMAPEQERGEETDHRADIYSLGVTLYEALAGKHPPMGVYVELAATNEAIPPEIDELIVKCLEENKDRRLSSLKEFIKQLEGALRPSRPLSEILSQGKLHELAAAIEPYTPREFAQLPLGQRSLILEKMADIVASDDPRLELASEQFLRLLLIRGLHLSRQDYREVVVPAIEWGFARPFGGRTGKYHVRQALEQAATTADGDAHHVLMEEFSKFVAQVDIEDQENWFLHGLREIISALLANPACISGAEHLVNGLRRLNKIQRSRPVSGAWPTGGAN